MNQWDVRGKYWILPDGSVRDVGADEHARIARSFMLGLADDELYQIKPQDIFRPLTKAEVKHHLDRGIKKEIVNFLAAEPVSVRVVNKKIITNGRQATVDPRLYVIENCGWIRSRENCFYAWLWDEATTTRALNCGEFWKKQNTNNDSWLDFVEVKTGREFGMTLLDVNYGLLDSEYPEPIKC